MRRLACIVILVVLIMQNAQAIELSAASAALIDTISGRLLYDKDANTVRGMASTTKIMTAIIALERGKLSDMVKVSFKAANIEGSKMYIKQGEMHSLEELLYGLLLNSGNDAAIAIAEHIGGTEEKFAQMMTDKARELGAKNTIFKNPHGLHQPGHCTTAYELALIARYALKNPKFSEIVKTKAKTTNDPKLILKNQNKLLTMYNGCDGVKTGYTPETGRTLVCSATRGNWQVVAVTLNDRDDWNDHSKLFDYAFNSFEPKELIKERQQVCSVEVKNYKAAKLWLSAQSGVTLPVKKELMNKVELKPSLPKEIVAPIAKGQQIGAVSVIVGGKEEAVVPLVADSDIEIKKVSFNIFTYIFDILIRLLSIIRL